MDDDQGIEQAICISVPPVGDKGDAGKCVPREVLENSVEYLVRKAASKACAH